MAREHHIQRRYAADLTAGRWLRGARRMVLLAVDGTRAENTPIATMWAGSWLNSSGSSAHLAHLIWQRVISGAPAQSLGNAAEAAAFQLAATARLDDLPAPSIGLCSFSA